MNIKISGVFKKICHRGSQSNHEKCRDQPPSRVYPKQDTIKLATVRLTPSLMLLSFRVSKNFLYFSFARPGTDLLEFYELCSDESLNC
ncbi:unnamed protein product [Arctia plantaginis]|uniref:Uncharacterized protein n=1 Tax=Arctia plantaginis TaxID=874455 RepID=A0A8S1BBM2_ARCPL|nr:unnamed protein product [Arctia plantaginis]CAB3256249.1 unnamed protein product [Arctia plantaginis]